MCNDLAKAMKALDGKKKSTATNFLQTYPGFNIAHTPSIVTENGGLSGGVAILISCAFRLLREVVITPGKLIAAQVQTRTDRFWIVSAYCHPNSARDDCEALARWLADRQDDSDPFLLSGTLITAITSLLMPGNVS